MESYLHNNFIDDRIRVLEEKHSREMDEIKQQLENLQRKESSPKVQPRPAPVSEYQSQPAFCTPILPPRNKSSDAIYNRPQPHVLLAISGSFRDPFSAAQEAFDFV